LVEGLIGTDARHAGDHVANDEGGTQHTDFHLHQGHDRPPALDTQEKTTARTEAGFGVELTLEKVATLPQNTSSTLRAGSKPGEPGPALPSLDGQGQKRFTDF
jgi:hypothetical protein